LRDLNDGEMESSGKDGQSMAITRHSLINNWYSHVKEKGLLIIKDYLSLLEVIKKTKPKHQHPHKKKQNKRKTSKGKNISD
jgi:hypothetical protein